MSLFEDFPIGFAEQINNSNNNNEANDTVFYVEWLDNSSEFPGLASATTKSELEGGNWELLQRKETNMDEDEHTLLPLKEDASWSNLNTKQTEKPYAQVAEEAAELGPSKRKVQPLWSNVAKSSKKEQEQSLVIVEEDDGDYSDLYYNHKGQSRRSSHLGRRRRMRDFNIIDIYVEGFLRVAASKSGKFTVLAEPTEHTILYNNHVNNMGLACKADALRYSSNFLGASKKWLKTGKKPHSILDVGEYTVYNRIID